LLAFAPGTASGAVFGVEGWRVQSFAEAGPFHLIFAVPEDEAASPIRLAAAAGALVVLAARPMAGCTPTPRKS
jgi:hypothetical protein